MFKGLLLGAKDDPGLVVNVVDVVVVVFVVVVVDGIVPLTKTVVDTKEVAKRGKALQKRSNRLGVKARQMSCDEFCSH